MRHFLIWSKPTRKWLEGCSCHINSAVISRRSVRGLWAIPFPYAAHSSPDQNGTDRIRRQTSDNSDVEEDFRLAGMIDQPDFYMA